VVDTADAVELAAQLLAELFTAINSELGLERAPDAAAKLGILNR